MIVGAGSAGCVLADRLSAGAPDRGWYGESGDPPEIQARILFPRLFGSDLDWNFATVPQRVLADRTISVPRGKAVGDSSVINAQLWTRGRRADYDTWAETGPGVIFSGAGSPHALGDTAPDRIKLRRFS
ncbi:GMC family oxidoreductase N-terminal domain-containing protein [Streptomyces sp. NPDC051172]|uniref:GMC family oxidoreductase N-terminal domain-containing protein n=1 Tax=Streptomyces sp. NPDC051172 TaxID=3155796 RepID=UPI00341B354E